MATLEVVDVSRWDAVEWQRWGTSVKRRRVMAGWSRDDLERESGVSAETVRTIEDGDRGRWRPRRLATYREIEAALGQAQPMPAVNGDRLDALAQQIAEVRQMIEQQDDDRRKVGGELIASLNSLATEVARLADEQKRAAGSRR